MAKETPRAFTEHTRRQSKANVSHYVRRRRATVATISNLRSISSHTAANTIVTTIPPQPSTNITLQSSPWNSATVVTVVIGAGALFVAILTLVLKYHGKVKRSDEQTAKGRLADSVDRVTELWGRFVAGVERFRERLNANASIRVEAVKRWISI